MMPKTRFGNNVHNQFGGSPTDNVWGDLDLEGAVKHFITPGQDLTGLLLRAGLPNVAVANAVVTFIARCQECHDKKHEKMAWNWIAAQCSIRGLPDGTRVNTLLQAVVGQLEASRRNRMRMPWGKDKDAESAEK